jgi:hypothetical protein
MAFMRLNTEFGNVGELAICGQLVRESARRAHVERDRSVAPATAIANVLV